MKKLLIPRFYLLVLILVMNHCTNHDADPLEPEQSLVDGINEVTLDALPLTKPAPVQTTESKVEVSAQTTSLNSEILGLGSTGVESDHLSASANQFSSALSAGEVSDLGNINNDVFQKIKSGGAVPANLEAILSKAALNTALSQFMPKTTLPTVSGVSVSALRTGASHGVDQVEKTTVSDECIAAAEKEFQKVKAKLDAERLDYLAAALKEYNTQLSDLSTEETSCKTAVPLKFTAIREEATKLYNTLMAALEAKSGSSRPDYLVLKAELNFEFLALFAVLNVLEQADSKACTTRTAACTTNAESAHKANEKAIEDSYTKALAEAQKLKTELAQSCHNQGAGR